MHNPKKIFLMHYSPVNSGAVAMAESAIESIQKTFLKSEIIIESDFPKQTRKMFPNVKVVKRAFSTASLKVTRKSFSLEFIFKNFSFLTRVILVFLFSFLAAIFKFKKTPFSGVNAMIGSDLVISLAGDSISQDYSYILRFYEFWLIKRFNTPNILYAQSVGPFDGNSRKLAQRSLNWVTAILARDKKTIELMKKYGVKVPIYRTADAAIMLPTITDKEVKKVVRQNNLNKAKKVGIVIRDIKFTQYSEEEYDKYQKGMVNIIKFLEKLNLKPIFVTSSIVDFNAILKFKKKYDVNYPIIKLFNYKPSQDKGILQILYFLISPRMHPIILASSSDGCVPVICLGREFKMKEYMDLAGLKDNYLDMIPFKEDLLKKKIKKLITNYDKIKSKLERSLPKMKRMSSSNIDIVKKIIS